MRLWVSLGEGLWVTSCESSLTGATRISGLKISHSCLLACLMCKKQMTETREKTKYTKRKAENKTSSETRKYAEMREMFVYCESTSQQTSKGLF